MRPKDRPAGRTCPMNEHLEEPIVIDVEGPEIAGANARSPSPDPSPEYEDPEEVQVLMEDAEEGGPASRDRSPVYTAPGEQERSRDSSAERILRSRAYYTEGYKNHQVNKVSSNVAQVTEGRKRGQQDWCSTMPRRGRPRWQSISPETRETGNEVERRRSARSQEPFCECRVCQQFPERSMEAVDPTESGRRRLKVVSTWTPEPRSRTSLSTKQRSRTQKPTSRTQEQRSRFETRRRSESTSLERQMREAQDCLLRETRRQVKKETKILDKARSALIREINMGAKEIRAMGKRLKSLNDPGQDKRCGR